MTTSRLTILLAVLLAGLGAVSLLPRELAYQPVGVNLELPQFTGEWYGQDLKVSDVEIGVLGADTEFSRKSYTNGRGDRIEVSIVLSGQDMNTSIHRPERCLPAQGWTIAGSHSVDIPIPGQPALPTTRLYNLRNLPTDHGAIAVHSLNYYWFAGHTDVTASHNWRTWLDVRDRVLHGYNQRWAYISVTSVITDNLQKFGRSREETSHLVEDFIRQIVPVIHKDALKKS